MIHHIFNHVLTTPQVHKIKRQFLYSSYKGKWKDCASSLKEDYQSGEKGVCANMLYVFVIPVIPKLISFIRAFAIDISKIFIVVLYYFFNVRVPRSFDIVSIVFDCFINVMEVKVTMQLKMSLSLFVCWIDTFLLSNFISNISTEKLKICTERIWTTNL